MDLLLDVEREVSCSESRRRDDGSNDFMTEDLKEAMITTRPL